MAVLITQNLLNKYDRSKLDGKKGTQMFAVSSLKAVENPADRSNVGVVMLYYSPSSMILIIMLFMIKQMIYGH